MSTIQAPLLRKLSDNCRESAYLTYLQDTVSLYIYAVELPSRHLARTAVGDRGPLHCTALGKAMLSQLPMEDVLRIIEQTGLKQYTPVTITNADQLLEELKLTRERGFAWDCGEYEQRSYCLAASIFDRRGKVFGACSISGNDPEIVGTRLEQLSSHVMQTAQEISRQMGYIPNPFPSLTRKSG